MEGLPPERLKKNSQPSESIEITRTPEQQAELRTAVAEVRRRALEEHGDVVLIDADADNGPVIVEKPFQVVYEPPMRRISEPMPDPSQSLAALEEAVAALQKRAQEK